MRSLLFFSIIVLFLFSVLLFSLGVGKLARDVEKEVSKISCRPDCVLFDSLRLKPREDCIKFCKEILK